jgi:hypothetical protein
MKMFPVTEELRATEGRHLKPYEQIGRHSEAIGSGIVSKTKSEVVIGGEEFRFGVAIGDQIVATEKPKFGVAIGNRRDQEEVDDADEWFEALSNAFPCEQEEEEDEEEESDEYDPEYPCYAVIDGKTWHLWKGYYVEPGTGRPTGVSVREYVECFMCRTNTAGCRFTTVGETHFPDLSPDDYSRTPRNCHLCSLACLRRIAMAIDHPDS